MASSNGARFPTRRPDGARVRQRVAQELITTDRLHLAVIGPFDDESRFLDTLRCPHRRVEPLDARPVDDDAAPAARPVLVPVTAKQYWAFVEPLVHS